jgi:hypothetical protein
MKYTTSGTYKESWDDYLMSYYGDPYDIPLHGLVVPDIATDGVPTIITSSGYTVNMLYFGGTENTAFSTSYGVNLRVPMFLN